MICNLNRTVSCSTSGTICDSVLLFLTPAAEAAAYRSGSSHGSEAGPGGRHSSAGSRSGVIRGIASGRNASFGGAQAASRGNFGGGRRGGLVSGTALGLGVAGLGYGTGDYGGADYGGAPVYGYGDPSYAAQGYGYNNPGYAEEGYGYGAETQMPGLRYRDEPSMQTGRSVATLGGSCSTPVLTCQLTNASYVGGGCSCRVSSGRSRGRVTP